MCIRDRGTGDESAVGFTFRQSVTVCIPLELQVEFFNAVCLMADGQPHHVAVIRHWGFFVFEQWSEPVHDYKFKWHESPVSISRKWMNSDIRLSLVVECTLKSRHFAPLKRMISLGVPGRSEVFITSPSFRILELNIHSKSSSVGNPAMLTRILPP